MAARFRRVRIAEQPEADGGKSVWHQAEGVELVSRVDRKGHVHQQDLTLGDRIVEWRKGEPLRTARARGQERDDPLRARGSGLVDRDPTPNTGALVTAVAFLRKVPPGDRYVEHMARALEAQMAAAAPAPGDTVTQFSAEGIPPLSEKELAPKGRRAPLLAVAVIAVVAAAAVGFLLLR